MKLAFALGGPEILVLLVLIGLPVVIVLVVLPLVRANRSAPPPVAPPPSREDRLRELDALKGQGLIDEGESEAKRKAILDEL